MENNRDRDVERGQSTGSITPNTPRPAEASAEDLARYCLELDTVESKRGLAWTNSICLAFLIIGFIGLKQPPIPIVRRALPQDETAPVVIEPLVSTVQTVSPDSPEEQVNESPEEATGVAVVLDSPAVAFSVPTVGNILVAMDMAQAPPSNPMQPVAPLNAPRIEQTTVTGRGGSRPQPFYPFECQRAREQGTVTLLIEVNEAGRVSSVKIKKSTGYARLDRAAADHVRKVWFFSPGEAGRMYECSIAFQLQ